MLCYILCKHKTIQDNSEKDKEKTKNINKKAFYVKKKHYICTS